ncbi:MAG: hypothetical protein P4M08_05875 [Oligoflexia bacterium]|nr:hypothetical protein [Oligoflexia bacterium]
MFFTQLGTMNSKQQVQGNVAATAMLIRSNLVNILGNEVAWNNTVAANSSMACLINGGVCTAGALPVAFALRDSANNVLLDPAQANLGFAMDGSTCKTFDANKGNDACPFQFTLTWQPSCIGACTAGSAQAMVQAASVYKPASVSQTTSFNGGNYGLKLQIGATANKRFQVTNALMVKYNPSFPTDCGMSNTSSKWYGNQACNLYCGAGSGSLPGLGYSGGIMTQCDTSGLASICVCVP